MSIVMAKTQMPAPPLPLSAVLELETPLRLSVAATIAFPDGSMTASGLRRESVRGRLVVERIAGKDYTTLGNIERMRELCRVERGESVSGCDSGDRTRVVRSVKPPGSFSTATSISPQVALRTKLRRQKANLPNTSPQSINPRAKSATSSK